MKYKAVIFDLYGTLVDNFSIKEYEQTLFAMAEILEIEKKEFYELWRKHFRERSTGIFRTTEACVEFICKKMNAGASADRVSRAAEKRREYTEKALKPRPEAMPVIKKLKAMNYKTGLISDCTSETAEIWPKTSFNGIFDTTVFSCVAGVKKPDPRIYAIAADNLDVQAADCLYVGDGSSNELTGAKQFGMNPVMIQVPDESVDSGYIDREADWQGQTIGSLMEVLDLV